jgi:magnesium-transporting ATPase (P-type)
MKYQRFVSLTAMLSFVILALSSVILYFIPDRKVTSWTNWSFLGLDKQQWDNLHINLGILFLVMIVWHIYFNWKPIKNYLKEKKRLKIFTKEFNVALAVTTLFAIGTIFMVTPFSFLVNIGNGVKAMNSLDDGNPPFGYAEYSTLEDFCLIVSIDIQDATKKLKTKNIVINSTKDMSKTISLQNNISPKDIFNIIKTNKTKFNLPTDIPIGIAKKSLLRLSDEYNIDLNML